MKIGAYFIFSTLNKLYIIYLWPLKTPVASQKIITFLDPWVKVNDLIYSKVTFKHFQLFISFLPYGVILIPPFLKFLNDASVASALRQRVPMLGNVEKSET